MSSSQAAASGAGGFLLKFCGTSACRERGMLPSDRCGASGVLCRLNSFTTGCVINQPLLVPAVKQVATPPLLICFVSPNFSSQLERFCQCGHTCILSLPGTGLSPLHLLPFCLCYPGARSHRSSQILGPPRKPTTHQAVHSPPAAGPGFKTTPRAATFLGSNLKRGSLWGRVGVACGWGWQPYTHTLDDEGSPGF